MRLRHLEIAGFRGYASTETFDLDADAVILVGANGSGKTSFFDAILWALTGSVSRLGSSKNLVSTYSTSGEALVELRIGVSEDELVITRRYDGQSHLSVQVRGGPSIKGVAAESALLERLWPNAEAASEPWETLSRSVTRAIYLQQDLVREFVESDGDEGRFNVVSELVGAGQVGELQRQLENARKRWTGATNVLARELEPLRSEREALQARLTRLTASPDEAPVTASWQEWSQAVAAALEDRPVDLTPNDRSLERALAALEGAERQLDRRAAALDALASHADNRPAPAPDLSALREETRAAEHAYNSARESLSTIEADLARERRLQTEERDEVERTRTFARLALEHLDETCPVCAQSYDIGLATERLQGLAQAESPAESPDSSELEHAAQEVEERERALIEARGRLAEAEHTSVRVRQWEDLRDRLIREAEVPASDDVVIVAGDELRRLEQRRSDIRRLRQDGEQLSLVVARAEEAGQRSSLQARLENLDREIAGQQTTIDDRIATGEMATRVIEALRDAGQSVVLDELRRIEPLLQRIFSTVDPHPTFRAVRFLASLVRGHGRLATTVGDPSISMPEQTPATVLSSSQLNVLAVASFLSLNLAVEALPVRVTALDDPLQSLDTVNLLGLADLLRRVKDDRQVIVSTHDERLAGLLGRKLRPGSAEERTRLIRLEGWARQGPTVTQSSVEPEPAQLRLVASGP